MSKIKVQVEHTPNFVEYAITKEELRAMLQPLSLRQALLWDSNYWYISHEDWGRIFADVLLNQPKYLAEKFDCEQFALLTTARVGSKFKLNTCGIAIGQSPYGYHGYCVFLSRIDGEDKLFILEPQNGLIYPMEQPEGYKPELIIFA